MRENTNSSDLSLRPRPGETAADVIARVEKAAKALTEKKEKEHK